MVRDIVQETWSKTIPKKKKCKKAKWLSTNSCEKQSSQKQRRKGKIYPFECRVSKNSKERQEAFCSDQCKEIEGKNRIRKTRDLFRKIRATKGTFHEKMDTIKDRNSIDLQKQKILLRGGNNTQKSYTK